MFRSAVKLRGVHAASKRTRVARAPPTCGGSRDLRNIRDANLLSLMSCEQDGVQVFKIVCVAHL